MKINRLLGVLLAAGSIMAVTATTASAFTPSVTGEAECLDDGSWKVTWSVTGSFLSLLDTWDLPSHPDFDPAGPVSADVVKTGTTLHAADEVEATETFVFERVWTNGDVKNGSATATVARPADGCTPPPPPPPPSDGGEWCSPGYWRQPQHLGSWDATGLSPDDLYNDVIASHSVAGDPTLLEVLQSPQTYGGGAFNAVGDLLSAAHPDVDFDGERAEDSCPLGRADGDGGPRNASGKRR